MKSPFLRSLLVLLAICLLPQLLLSQAEKKTEARHFALEPLESGQHVELSEKGGLVNIRILKEPRKDANGERTFETVVRAVGPNSVTIFERRLKPNGNTDVSDARLWYTYPVTSIRAVIYEPNEK